MKEHIREVFGKEFSICSQKNQLKINYFLPASFYFTNSLFKLYIFFCIFYAWDSVFAHTSLFPMPESSFLKVFTTLQQFLYTMADDSVPVLLFIFRPTFFFLLINFLRQNGFTYLQNYCTDGIESSCITHAKFSLLVISYIITTFGTTNESSSMCF